MVSSVEQAFVGRNEIRAPLKKLVWEAKVHPDDQTQPTFVLYFVSRFVSLVFIRLIIFRVQIKSIKNIVNSPHCNKPSNILHVPC